MTKPTQYNNLPLMETLAARIFPLNIRMGTNPTYTAIGAITLTQSNLILNFYK